MDILENYKAWKNGDPDIIAPELIEGMAEHIAQLRAIVEAQDAALKLARPWVYNPSEYLDVTCKNSFVLNGYGKIAKLEAMEAMSDASIALAMVDVPRTNDEITKTTKNTKTTKV